MQIYGNAEVMLIGSADRMKVTLSDRADGPDHALGPLNDRVIVHAQPDVPDYPGPSPVAILERVDADRSVMQADGLPEPRHPVSEIGAYLV